MIWMQQIYSGDGSQKSLAVVALFSVGSASTVENDDDSQYRKMIRKSIRRGELGAANENERQWQRAADDWCEKMHLPRAVPYSVQQPDENDCENSLFDNWEKFQIIS